MSDETPTDQAEQTDSADTVPAVDGQGNDAPVVPTDAPTSDAPAVDADPVLYDERDDKIDTLEAELAAANDRIAELESSPASDGGNDFGGVRTPALDAFEENQFKGEVQAWERDTGLSYEDTEPDDGSGGEAGVG